MEIQTFWNQFLVVNNMPPATPYKESFYFGLDKETANSLAKLVLRGTKRATSSLYDLYDLTLEKLPAVGDYSIVTDWDGQPKCIIRTTAVHIIPFDQMTFEVCSREGEDKNLESWKRTHKRCFEQEMHEAGKKFLPTMDVVFEDFEVVFS